MTSLHRWATLAVASLPSTVTKRLFSTGVSPHKKMKWLLMFRFRALANRFDRKESHSVPRGGRCRNNHPTEGHDGRDGIVFSPSPPCRSPAHTPFMVVYAPNVNDVPSRSNRRAAILSPVSISAVSGASRLFGNELVVPMTPSMNIWTDNTVSTMPMSRSGREGHGGPTGGLDWGPTSGSWPSTPQADDRAASRCKAVRAARRRS